MADMRWQVVSRQCILSDAWIQLYADTCITMAGETIAPYYVLEGPDAVHVVALTPDDRMVLVRQYRHASGDSPLELPGGMMDKQDAGPADTARRELLEETGFSAPQLQHIFSLSVDPARNRSLFHAFAALGAVEVAPQRLDAGEQSLRVELTPIAAVVEGLVGGLITPAPHVAAILLGLAILGKLPLKVP